ncbi:ATP-binding protein [Sinomonas gamaensis]|uniref:ATP-binding protein n=1 Tax=Sinomonas gamaensis TaxID=2565624 RepID=UPI0011096805|nr:ATP-binding protein [Sinomonas gamaensis]
MSGVDTVRGINYQHGQAILIALEVAADDSVLGIRVEGAVDALDLEVIADDPGGAGPFVARGLQMKSRLQPYTWARAELLAIVHRWAELQVSADSEFSLLTDGALGPSGHAVAAALDEAREGKYDAVAELLGVDIKDPLCAVMGRARIVSEPGAVEALLRSAEMEVKAMLETGPAHPDAEKEASDRVNELFRVISTRSGLPDSDDRFISRDEIVGIVGDIARIAEVDRWTGPLAGEYLAAVASEQIDDLVVPTLSASWQRPPIRLEDLALVTGPLLMTGRTGSGKSTLSRLWRRGAARAGGKVIVCHAEAYLARRLDRLVADAVGTAVGRALSRRVGRQVLGDPSVTVILDGVSEIPQQERSELAADLRAHLAGAHGSRVVGVARDEGVGATVFPSSVSVQRLYPRAFDLPERLALTAKVLGAPESAVSSPVTVDGMGPAALAGSGGGEMETFSRRCHEALAQVEHALGDAAGNPMLLELALQLVAGGVPFTDRASVYELTVSRMSHRANAGDLRLAVAVLGVVFSELLNEGRRYANPLEWERMIAGATAFLEERGVAIDVAAIREAVARSGLINAVITGIGHTTLRVPVHDSFADYFAARAQADGLVLLPETLLENDENRVWLSSQMRMLSDSEVMAVAKHLPFSLVRVSESDHNTISDQTPGMVAALLNAVLPDETAVDVTMWRTANGETMAQAGTGATRWVDPAQAPAVFAGPTVVVEDSDGPTAVAVRLWRLILGQRLRRRDRWLRPRDPRSRQEACDQLSAHCHEVIAAVKTVLTEVAPTGTINRLQETIGPLGMTGVVYERQGRFRLDGWPVRYRHTEAVHLAAAYHSSPPPEERTGEYSAWTDVVSQVSTSPEITAAKAVGEAVTKLTRSHWL